MAARVIIFRTDAVIAARAAVDAPPIIYIDVQAPQWCSSNPARTFYHG
jgi:hypothetical protein